MMRALSIHSTPASARLQPAGAIALPVAVETAALAVPFADELRVLINHPSLASATQLRLLSTQTIEQLPALPMVVAAAAPCGQELLVTGADASGRPTVLGVAADGRVCWQHRLNGSVPTLWPVPGCAPQPVIAWQTTLGKLEIANCGASGIEAARSISVEGAPLDVAIGGGAVWAAWPNASEIHCIGIMDQDTRRVGIEANFPGSFALGGCPEGACIAWARGDSAFLARISSEARLTGPPVALELPRAGNVKLAVVCGPEPLVWAQRGEFIEGQEGRWTSALVLPGSSPLIVEGFVHAVAWWGNVVIVIGWEEIRFMKREDL